MLIALHCSSEAQKKELLKHLKPDTIKAICECSINIINSNITMSYEEKKIINRNRNKIRELVNPKTSQKKRKEILVQEGGVFLAPLLSPVLGSLVGPLLKGITGGQMAERKKHIVLAPEVYEMLLIKAETPVNPITLTIKQIQENLNNVWSCVGISKEEKV